MTSASVGLCATCLQARRITSGKGAIFWLCRRSEHDASFPKYPALPVLRCRGYDPAPAEPPDPRAGI
jgi:hypothetical protein